jgi:hypothetical protein
VQTILRVRQRQSEFKPVAPNDPVTFDCYGAKFFLESGFQWALKRLGSPLQYLINQGNVLSQDLQRIRSQSYFIVKCLSIIGFLRPGNSDEESIGELHEWISIPLGNLTTGTVSVMCIAPTLYSPDKWVNVTEKYKRRL